jgi:hypothetical protein
VLAVKSGSHVDLDLSMALMVTMSRLMQAVIAFGDREAAALRAVLERIESQSKAGRHALKAQSLKDNLLRQPAAG